MLTVVKEPKNQEEILDLLTNANFGGDLHELAPNQGVKVIRVDTNTIGLHFASGQYYNLMIRKPHSEQTGPLRGFKAVQEERPLASSSKKPGRKKRRGRPPKDTFQPKTIRGRH